MQTIRSLALLLAVVLVIPTIAVATEAPSSPAADPVQDRRHGKRGDGGRGERRAKLPPEQRSALRERVKGKIQTYLTVELSSRAGLDEKKSLQLGSAIKAHLERKEAARGGRREAVAKLRELVDGKAADAALKSQMKAVIEMHHQQEALDTLLDETARFLTPTEQARMLVALPDVMKDAMNLMREARGTRGERRGGDDE